MEVLPEELTIDILSRLPVKTIFHCRRVCKKWRNLVSDSCFINLHLSRSPTTLLLHRYPPRAEYLGILMWLEIQDKLVDLHRHPMMVTFDLKRAPILQNSRINHMGSVNGLICQWQSSLTRDDIYICNPITREYMILPRSRYYKQGFVYILYGFGVSSLTGEYKVVRIFQNDNKIHKRVLEAEIYTLGTGQWRSLGRVPRWLYDFYGAFLNGYCHWIACGDKNGLEKICRFDLDKETFELFPSPPIEFDEQNLGVLKGCLCEVDASCYQFTIWVMKEYGIKESWHKELVITKEISYDLDWQDWDAMPMYLIEGLKDGSILMVYDRKLWIFYPRSETIEVADMFDFLETGLAYRPSFLKLQNFESVRCSKISTIFVSNKK